MRKLACIMLLLSLAACGPRVKTFSVNEQLDVKEQAPELYELAHQGDPAAMYTLGVYYLNYDRKEWETFQYNANRQTRRNNFAKIKQVDMYRGLRCLRDAAMKGYKPAQQEITRMVEEGLFDPQSFPKTPPCTDF